MTNRLSEDVRKKVYHAGLTPFEQGAKQFQHFHQLQPVNLSRLLKDAKGKELIQALPPQQLYFSLKKQGLSENLEALELISTDQWVRVCDYDIWHEDNLSTKELFVWLKAFQAISPKEMYQRFRSLDEECQIAAINPLVQVIDNEEYEQLSASEQDRLYRFPGEELYYRLLSDDPEIVSGFEDLMAACMQESMPYAMSLVAHAGYMPPAESEETLRQFRQARLEEDGFVTFSEGEEAFHSQKGEDLLAKWEKLRRKQSKPEPLPSLEKNPYVSFLEKAFHQVAQEHTSEFTTQWQTMLLHLSNSLCASTKLEPDDTHGLEQLLEHTLALVSLGLESLSLGCLETAAAVLNTEHPKAIFQAGLAKARGLQARWLSALDRLPILRVDKLKKDWQLRKYHSLHTWFDQQVHLWGSLETEKIKALFNRFPLISQKNETDDGATRVTFSPISSLKEWHALADYVDQWVVHMEILLLSESNLQHDWEKSRNTAFANVLLGKTLNSASLDPNEKAKFLKLSDNAKQSALNELILAFQKRWQDNFDLPKDFILTERVAKENWGHHFALQLEALTARFLNELKASDHLEALIFIDNQDS